jgi:hypothetical protein
MPDPSTAEAAAAAEAQALANPDFVARRKQELTQAAQFVLDLVAEGEPQPNRRAALTGVAKANLDKLLKAAGAI